MIRLRQFFPPRSSRGFTLIEVVVTLGIIGIISAAGFYLAGNNRPAKFDDDVRTTLTTLQEIQSAARGAKSNQEYGMCFTSSTWSTFSRDSGDQADPCAGGFGGTIDSRTLRAATMSTSLTPSTNKVVFDRVTGKPAGGTQGTVTFSLTDPARSRVLHIRSTGVLYVQ